jgi:CheY-like chemotaxis protein/anti-sigma regulatory factor (Ser/Thr protein kinase)
MASGIAHDINNAISPVTLYTDMLLETEPDLSERTRKYLEIAQLAMGDVSQTVARMSEFYRKRQPELKLAPVDLNLLVQQVVDLTQARWSDIPQQKGVVVELRKDLMPELPAIDGVESEVREALTNLIFNAVDAMPNGGVLTLRTVSSSQRIHVEVTDTGTGMDEETRRKCLEPFFTTKGERGSGLGLAMVYGIVKRHAADLEIESSLGSGTTIRVSFSAASATPDSRVDANPVPRHWSILLVDDDPLLIKSLRDALEGDGHTVTYASGGEEGIAAFRTALERSQPFEVVITDLGMPYVDGRKVASAVRAASETTPVILLTGWGQRLTTEGDVPPHVNCVLSKPPKLNELRAALAQCASKTSV